MEYQDELTTIFGDRGPKSLRALFDVDSNEWEDTTMIVKQNYLKRMLNAHPLNYWIDQYKLQYQNTHPHIIDAIERSIKILNVFDINNSIQINSKVDLVVEKVSQVIQFNTDIDNEYFYSNVPFCVIDSIFSIGVRYEGVKNVLKNVSNKLDIPATAIFIDGSRKDSITTSAFLSKISQWDGNEMAKELYKNHQRTSSSNGILKAEAALEFVKILIKYKVERFVDVKKVFNNDAFEKDIKAIKGQSSGISLKYFYMLAGNEDMIKPDRMIMRFLEDILGKAVKMNEAQEILYQAASKISLDLNKPISAMLLDNHIWKYQRVKWECKVNCVNTTSS